MSTEYFVPCNNNVSVTYFYKLGKKDTIYARYGALQIDAEQSRIGGEEIQEIKLMWLFEQF